MNEPDRSIIKKHIQDSKSFSSLFFDFATDDILVKEEATKELALGAISESMELMNAVNWKTHHKEKAPVSRSKILEQIIDIYKYAMSAAALWNVTPEEFCNEFERKSLVNIQRYRQETTLQTLNASSKIAAIDIDGVLCKYPEDLIKYMNARFNRNLKLTDVKTLHGVEDAYLKAGVAPSEYRLAKQDFIEEGWYSKQSRAFPGASDFTHKLKALGFTIVLLSARPYQQFNRIFGDTLEWCQANKIAFDIVYWDKEKDLRIIKTFKNLSFLLDDDVDNVREVARAGYKAFLFDRPYNAHVKSLPEKASIVHAYSDVIYEATLNTGKGL